MHGQARTALTALFPSADDKIYVQDQLDSLSSPSQNLLCAMYRYCVIRHLPIYDFVFEKTCHEQMLVHFFGIGTEYANVSGSSIDHDDFKIIWVLLLVSFLLQQCHLERTCLIKVATCLEDV